MRTTLNIPDTLVMQAKRRALEEGKTLTDLLVEGLQSRLARSLPRRGLPISSTTGGLRSGVSWAALKPRDATDEEYR